MIGPSDERGTMRGEDQGAAAREIVEGGENRLFRLLVEPCRDFVEDDEGASLEEGARKAETSPLAGGQRMSARAERRGKPVGKRCQEAAERRLLKGGAHGALRRTLLPQADVFGERRVEYMRFLRHIGDERAARGWRKMREVIRLSVTCAVLQDDRSFGRREKTGEKIEQGRLARTARADERGLLARAKVEIEPLEDGFLCQRIAIGKFFGKEARRHENLIAPAVFSVEGSGEPRQERLCCRVRVHGGVKGDAAFSKRLVEERRENQHEECRRKADLSVDEPEADRHGNQCDRERRDEFEREGGDEGEAQDGERCFGKGAAACP